MRSYFRAVLRPYRRFHRPVFTSSRSSRAFLRVSLADLTLRLADSKTATSSGFRLDADAFLEARARVSSLIRRAARFPITCRASPRVFPSLNSS